METYLTYINHSLHYSKLIQENHSTVSLRRWYSNSDLLTSCYIIYIFSSVVVVTLRQVHARGCFLVMRLPNAFVGKCLKPLIFLLLFFIHKVSRERRFDLKEVI